MSDFDDLTDLMKYKEKYKIYKYVKNKIYKCFINNELGISVDRMRFRYIDYIYKMLIKEGEEYRAFFGYDEYNEVLRVIKKKLRIKKLKRLI
jgi:hypothetical protein